MITLDLTHADNPEQYDAWDGSRRVGHLKLEADRFIVRCPDANGDITYDITLPDIGGRFSDVQRSLHLQKALNAIAAWVLVNGSDVCRAVPPEIVAVWQASIPMQAEYPDLLHLDWRNGVASRGALTIKLDRDVITFMHEKHGRIKTVPVGA